MPSKSEIQNSAAQFAINLPKEQIEQIIGGFIELVSFIRRFQSTKPLSINELINVYVVGDAPTFTSPVLDTPTFELPSIAIDGQVAATTTSLQGSLELQVSIGQGEALYQSVVNNIGILTTYLDTLRKSNLLSQQISAQLLQSIPTVSLPALPPIPLLDDVEQFLLASLAGFKFGFSENYGGETVDPYGIIFSKIFSPQPE